MVQISLIVLSIAGIIIINLLNKERPIFKLVGTAVIVLGCVLAMLYYYNIRMFTDTAMIVTTIVLSVCLLLSIYVIMILALSYRKGKIDVKKKDITKRSTFKKSDKKEKRRKLKTEISKDSSNATQDMTNGDDMSEKRKNKKSDTDVNKGLKTVNDYLNQIVNNENTENSVESVKDKATLKSQNKPTYPTDNFEEELMIEETENAEEWTPSLVTDDEIEAYMKEQYAWMEENKPEDELSMSVIFGDDENVKMDETPMDETPNEFHPEILDKTEDVKDIKVKANNKRRRKLADEPREIEIELEELKEYPEKEIISEQTDVVEKIADSEDDIQKQTKLKKRSRRRRKGDDEAEKLKDWVAAQAKANESERQIASDSVSAEMHETYEPAIENATFDENINIEPQGNFYKEEDKIALIDIEASQIDGEETYTESNEEPYEPFDFTQTLEQAIMHGEQQPPSEALIEETDEIDIISPVLVEDSGESAFVESQDSTFTDMLSDSSDDVLSIEEAEQYAKNFFDNNIAEQEEPQPVFVDILSEQTEDEISIEPVVVEVQPELTLAEKKDAEMAELLQLVAGKNYPEAMKKVFSILNAGYVMTPDEKQKMRLVMLTLKAKT